MKNQKQKFEIKPLIVMLVMMAVLIVGNSFTFTFQQAGAKGIAPGEEGYHPQLRCVDSWCLPTDHKDYAPHACFSSLGAAADYLKAGDSCTPPAPAGSDSPAEAPVINVVCQDSMDMFATIEMERYMEWMENHFQNKSSTTTLLNDAIGRYKQFRTALLSEYNKYIPQQNALLLTEGLERSACKQIVDDKLEEAERLLERKSKTTSTVKKATVLLDKYQEINGKLSKLSRDFATMRKYLDTFAAKLPCYIKRECNKS